MHARGVGQTNIFCESGCGARVRVHVSRVYVRACTYNCVYQPRASRDSPTEGGADLYEFAWSVKRLSLQEKYYLPLLKKENKEDNI